MSALDMILTVRGPLATAIHRAVLVDLEVVAEEAAFGLGGVEVDQPDGLVPARIDVWPRVGRGLGDHQRGEPQLGHREKSAQFARSRMVH